MRAQYGIPHAVPSVNYCHNGLPLIKTNSMTVVCTNSLVPIAKWNTWGKLVGHYTQDFMNTSGTLNTPIINQNSLSIC